MENIKWEKSYEVGIKKIDEEHKILINTINEFNNSSKDNYTTSNVENLIKDLLSYALYHFETEEELMIRYNYDVEKEDEYKLHIEKHRYFLTKISSIKKDLLDNKLVEKELIYNFLQDWFLNHINNIDKKLGKFLLEKI